MHLYTIASCGAENDAEENHPPNEGPLPIQYPKNGVCQKCPGGNLCVPFPGPNHQYGVKFGRLFFWPMLQSTEMKPHSPNEDIRWEWALSLF
jgi:hypothetical protein